MPETPTFARAAVAAPHALASETGRSILAEGGSALDATVAMAATIAVVYPHLNGLGGDGCWLIREPGGRMRAIEACGPAGRTATIEHYRKKGYDAIPARGPDAALTVAGAVAGWTVALDLARSVRSSSRPSLPLPVLLDNAIRFAREGYPVSRSEARCRTDEAEALRQAPGFAEVFLPDGRTPEAGSLRQRPALAETVSYLAHAGLDDFYRGDVGREIAADLERIGSPVTRADLAAFRARTVEPLAARIGPAVVYSLPPPAQGLTSLLLLGIFGHLKLSQGETADHAHGLIEATKRAFTIHDRAVTDPDNLTHDPAAFLTPAVFGREAAAVDLRRAAPLSMLQPANDDAIWMGAIDQDGLAVSYVQSICWTFGSGCVLPGTGVLWQNWGVAFSLDPRSRNPLKPGRQPFHTLDPALAVFDDGRTVSYGATGGDGQPQFQAQIFTRCTDGMGPADAIDAPRWLYGRTWGAGTATLKVEDRFDPDVLQGLADRGHEIEELGVPYAEAVGHAGMVVRHPGDGRVEAAHDPRSDGGAAGL
jgi:oxamate amidohydrolase